MTPARTRSQAVDVLLDKRIFDLDDAAFRDLVAILDNPPEPNEKLKALMARAAPWQA